MLNAIIAKWIKTVRKPIKRNENVNDMKLSTQRHNAETNKNAKTNKITQTEATMDEK